jgi:hypothetical protein
MIKWTWIDQMGVLQYFVTNPTGSTNIPKKHTPWG